MNNWIKKLFGGIIGVLLLFLGIEKRKNKKQAEKIAESEKQIKNMDYRIKVQKTTDKAKDDILAGQKERKEQKDAVDQKIAESSKKEDPHEKRETQQQIVDDINDLFNKRNTAK